MAYNHNNFYILCTESTVKLTWVKTVRAEGSPAPERNDERGKSVRNIRRAKTDFLDIGQSNTWDYMGTLTSGSDDPASDIRAFGRWIKDLNYNHGWKIRYLAVFELGDKGRRLHVHVLLKNVPPEFVREYTPGEYAKLPSDLKKLYSQYKTETGTRLATCPFWKFGWSTLIPIDGSPKVVSYMSKYMTKQNVEFTTRFGGHAYFASKGLNRPEKKKIPADIAATMWSRVPAGSWFRENRYLGDVVSTCYVLDKDKLPSDLWDYYNQLYQILQSGF